MTPLRRRIEALELFFTFPKGGQPEHLPQVLPADATEAELEDARRLGGLAFRDGDPALFDQFF